MPNRVIHSRLESLPKESLYDDVLQRTAIRGDDSLVTFNWIQSTDIKPPPHSHPRDQISLILQGTMEFEVSGELYTVSAGEVLQIPGDAPHTGRVVGDEVVLNVDVFAPVREDHLHLVAHQADAFDDAAS